MPVRQTRTESKIHVSLASVHQRAILDGYCGFAGLESQPQAPPLGVLYLQVSAVELSTNARIVHTPLYDHLRLSSARQVHGA